MSDIERLNEESKSTFTYIKDGRFFKASIFYIFRLDCMSFFNYKLALTGGLIYLPNLELLNGVHSAIIIFI